MAAPRRHARHLDTRRWRLPGCQASVAIRAPGAALTEWPPRRPSDSRTTRNTPGGTITKPTRATASGRAFLELQRRARLDARTTAEYLRLYALEGFLLRLAHSPDKSRLILKGGVLLAAYDLRRPTADIDIAALRAPGDVAAIRQLIIGVASVVLPADIDDGLTFDLTTVKAEAIREQEVYGGVRVRLLALLATAREAFHVDVNIGDPIWPAPVEISLPRLLDQEPIMLLGYPIEMILAEKIVTAIQRGQASTRWRDFGDIYALTGRHVFSAGQVRKAIQAVAAHRGAELNGLGSALEGYAEIGNARWAAWLSNLALTDALPARFADVLQALQAFAEPILTDIAPDRAAWDPGRRAWQPPTG
ncbi:MAG: nucleotidyl transferase AbiEii/AbiGii toxin family protein [Actinobacteria bacterium]|nr:nucleotidyl transferase AbiEii/AbiGii toxin family protein [Actinomycetota bacterium]